MVKNKIKTQYDKIIKPVLALRSCLQDFLSRSIKDSRSLELSHLANLGEAGTPVKRETIFFLDINY